MAQYWKWTEAERSCPLSLKLNELIYFVQRMEHNVDFFILLLLLLCAQSSLGTSPMKPFCHSRWLLKVLKISRQILRHFCNQYSVRPTILVQIYPLPMRPMWQDYFKYLAIFYNRHVPKSTHIFCQSRCKILPNTKKP